MNQPSTLTVSLPLTEAQAEKIGLGDRWRTAARKIASRRQRRSAKDQRFAALVATLLQHAEQEQWSQRKLAAQAGISWPSFLRCRSGRVDAATWLPRLEAALQRLRPS